MQGTLIAVKTSTEYDVADVLVNSNLRGTLYIGDVRSGYDALVPSGADRYVLRLPGQLDTPIELLAVPSNRRRSSVPQKVYEFRQV